MGSGQSARKLTISNEEEINVIKISDSIVQRLTTQNDVTESKVLLPVKAETSSIQEPKTTYLPQENSTVTSLPQPPPPSAPHGASAIPYHPQYTISALQMAQEKEKELAKQDNYWEERLQKLKDEHKKIDKILEEEYETTYNKYMTDQPKKGERVKTEPICTENTKKIIKCYQDNPKETLRCADLVSEFSNCVDKKRSNIIDARC